MTIGETLFFFRQNMNFTQKEILPEHDSSAYSRIENDRQDLKISDLSAILDRLSVSPEEFICRSPMNDEQKSFRELFQYCATHLTNQSKKAELYRQYEKLKSTKPKSLKQLSNYISIKVYFSQHWTEIEPVTKNELDDIFAYLGKKTYFLQYDYTLMSNTIFLMTDKQADLLINRAIPIKDEENRNHTTKQFAFTMITNLITSKLYTKDYDKVLKYLTLAKKQNKSTPDYKYKMTVGYLNNLYLYLTKGNYQYIKKVYDYIQILDDLDEKELSKMTEKEVELLTLSKDASPINTMQLT